MKQLFKIVFLGYLSFLVLATSCDSGNSGLNCGRLRNGLFRHQSRIGDVGDILIHRTDSIQIETYVNTGQQSKFSVTWTSPCNYELKKLESSVKYPDSIQQIRMDITLYVQILSFDKDHYVYAVSDQEGKIEVKDTLWVERNLRKLE
jgi:hypothetical protein